MTTYTDIVDSAEARARPILGEVCDQIADVQVRNRGTIGGNVCSNDPTNHLPPLLVALGATMTIVGPDGERTVPAEEFFLGVYMTAAGPGELLTKISVPPGKGDGFASVPIGKDGTCIVNVAASRRRRRAALAIGCVDAVPVLAETRPRRRTTRCAAAVAGAELDPPWRRPCLRRLPPPPGGGPRRARGRPGRRKELTWKLSPQDDHGRRQRRAATSARSTPGGC